MSGIELISRLQRSDPIVRDPGAMPQAFAFRAIGAWMKIFLCEAHSEDDQNVALRPSTRFLILLSIVAVAAVRRRPTSCHTK